jgi:hypothetical protein
VAQLQKTLLTRGRTRVRILRSKVSVALSAKTAGSPADQCFGVFIGPISVFYMVVRGLERMVRARSLPPSGT